MGLYHGTNNNILDTLYQHGLQPPSDTQASEQCPTSGRKGLCTSLCNNDCKYCTEKHEWSKCHMYGLGIYLADMAQKSHRYVSSQRLERQGAKLIVWLSALFSASPSRSRAISDSHSVC